MIYEVKLNPISGCQELISLAGVSSSTIGCVWKSTEAYACITDCADCSLGMINNAATQLGYTASASNSSTAIGLGATACCTSTAIGNGACADTADTIHIKGGCAEITNKCNCINISNEGSTAIDVSDTALNVNSEANIYLNVSCTCIDIKGCSAVAVIDDSAVIVGNSATGLSCSVSIGANATTAAACSTAIGYCATANCICGTAIGASAVTDAGVSIGRCAHSDVGSTAIGKGSYATNMGTSIGCYAGAYKCGCGATLIGDNTGGTCNSVVIGYLSRSCDNGVAIGYSSYAYGANKAIVVGYGSATLASETIVIGNDLTLDNTGCPGDTIIGSCSNVFKFCGATGYTYGNGCMMTGRILNCAAELPATNCSLLLYYVP